MLFAAATACGETSSSHPQSAGNAGTTATTTGGVAAGGSKTKPDSGGDAAVAGGGAASAGSAGNGPAGEAGDDTAGGSGGTAGAPSGGSAGAPDSNAILEVKPSPGCGTGAQQALGEFVRHTLQTQGTKDQNCADKLNNGTPVCGAWSLEREYFLWLPPGYDEKKAYPLVIEGTGCGGTGTAVLSLSPTDMLATAGVDGSVIRVGLTPPPASVGHATNPGQGCYDDKEGDDSVDLAFYEALLDSLKTQICYDENRVYAAGASSGAWLANELACKYAGDTKGHALRAVAADLGGLPNQPQFSPTCSTVPLAGIWIHEVDLESAPVDANKFAMARAMSLAGCTATDWDAAVASNQVRDYPIGAGNSSSSCKEVVGCAANYPLVMCEIRSGHTAHETLSNPAFAKLFTDLAAK